MKTSTRSKLTPASVLLAVFALACLGVVGLLLVRFLQGSSAGFGESLDLQKVDDHPLYVLHYQGDYGFEEFLKTGLEEEIYPTGRIKPARAWSCSVFAALSPQGESSLGRNFDWNNDPALLLFTEPAGAYASVSMVDIAFLGFGQGIPGEQERSRLVDAPYLPFDGMNEMGVAVGMMAVPYADGGHDPQKVTIGSLHAIRLVLDYARDVEQATSLLQDYNIDFEGGPSIHYLIADPAGNSAVVEYLEGQVVVTRNDQPWQVATNFILSGLSLEQCKGFCWRYHRAFETLSQARGQLSRVESMSLLQSVSQENTIWSVVYDLSSGEIQVVMGKKYDQPLNFKLALRIIH